MLGVRKTVIMLDEKNYLVYINHSLFKEKGTEFIKEKNYLKIFVECLWAIRRENPDTLKSADKIETLKNIFELEDLEII